ncbi:hypothetical protein [Legionella oakridgensis]|uniref:Uncharacterized protein n=2 Tax=Legionella oakridgensis TaxID=29423 RepID=W0BED2_9GAMM|nr:hypothetical protein [Legionella oakridgensis]AHE68230.1 hypothetical protein Loa_02698 [Legionella oakridgensis ATCC 33761 = DSM 21215]ETO92313.1 hypothetical protein LOR_64c17530 [Legionella oakridgensis RV-2-2007]KTD39575.1 hypothetical protein Loak_1001 [Legionella oakridgensis]STY21188.1 Uncharacterised protein [Legionella longbeachae]
MGSKQQTDSFRLLSVVDEDTRGGIINLNHKLKSLQAEVSAKLAMLEDVDDATTQKKEFLNFQQEIQKALDSIDGLVHMVVTDDVAKEGFLNSNYQENHDNAMQNDSNTIRHGGYYELLSSESDIG